MAVNCFYWKTNRMLLCFVIQSLVIVCSWMSVYV